VGEIRDTDGEREKRKIWTETGEIKEI